MRRRPPEVARLAAREVVPEAEVRLADPGEVAAARWLDAEDATMRQVLVWAMEHDAAVASRLAAALSWWWQVRGRLAGQGAVGDGRRKD